MPSQLDESEIENALKAVLGNASLGLPIAWPNRSAPNTRPYLDVEFVDSVREGGALKGQAEIERIEATMVVTVAVDNDGHTTTANDYAQQVAALYPEGTKINITNGQICMMLPNILKGFEALGHWRVPVRMPYMVSRV